MKHLKEERIIFYSYEIYHHCLSLYLKTKKNKKLSYRMKSIQFPSWNWSGNVNTMKLHRGSKDLATNWGQGFHLWCPFYWYACVRLKKNLSLCFNLDKWQITWKFSFVPYLWQDEKTSFSIGILVSKNFFSCFFVWIQM